eukprot:g75837.t1
MIQDHLSRRNVCDAFKKASFKICFPRRKRCKSTLDRVMRKTTQQAVLGCRGVFCIYFLFRPANSLLVTFQLARRDHGSFRGNGATRGVRGNGATRGVSRHFFTAHSKHGKTR